MEFIKDPDANLDYGFTLADWLATGESISSSTWAIQDDGSSPYTGLVQVSSSHDATTATIWLSGGTVGFEYSVTCHFVTSAGRQDDRTLMIKVEER